MSIVPLRKYTLFGRLADKEATIAALQDLGLLHVVPLVEREEAPIRRSQDVQNALKYLKECPEHRTQSHNYTAFDLRQVVDDALANRRELSELRDRREILLNYMKQLRPWGHFEFPPREDLGGYRFWFYAIPNYRMRQLHKTDLVWEEVYRDNRNSYVVVISVWEPEPGLVPAPRMRTGAKPLRQLEAEWEATEIAIEQAQDRRRNLTRWIDMFEQHLAEEADLLEREMVVGQTRDEGSFFIFQGWGAADREEAVLAFGEQEGLAVHVEPPAEDDEPPTLLDNPELLAGGEELVKFYQMPGYRSWDPSVVVFFSFAVFFAMILADACYGLVFGTILLALWRRLGQTRDGRRMRNLGLVLTGASIVYGVLIGSYFGATPDIPMLKAWQVLDITRYESMMLVAVFVGSGHIILANLISAWRRGFSGAALAPLGWVSIISGALVYGVAAMPALGQGLAIGGAALVFLFSSERPLDSVKNVALRIGEGFLGLTGLTQAFGDILSYLRLFALGLASASLAVTFNDLAAGFLQPGSNTGMVLALAIYVFGHTLNFALGLIGGVVHGLRLNLIEFYNWSLSDEGYAFQPFARAAKQEEMDSWTK